MERYQYVHAMCQSYPAAIFTAAGFLTHLYHSSGPKKKHLDCGRLVCLYVSAYSQYSHSKQLSTFTLSSTS